MSGTTTRYRVLGLPVLTPAQRVMGLFGFWLVLAVCGPFFAPYAPGQIIDTEVFAPLSHRHWLGTDYLGRDLGSRLLYAVRYTVLICTLSTAFSCSCGILLGIATTAMPAWVEQVAGRLMDGILSIPSLLCALLVIAAFGDSLLALILTMGVIYTPGAYRTSRALALRIARMDYITVAMARGEGAFFIIWKEILPNMRGPLLADVGLRFIYAVLLLSNLSFLGLGVQPPLVDLGSLVRENVLGLVYGSAAVILPTVVIGALTVGINLVLDGTSRR
ncbi:ABC transporter permease [Komagataeibacter nataicola]|nr:ABC transporter permease [Komagataeibacter nataicola]WEQ55958.1 ABC transporter permease [Komagataeibacter nataicola]WNM07387.1 ABC transporter permease [Komagataeibacter nataicola]GBR13405.1 dipeptide/oligopeptide/nickel ABC transporter permease [Komagataeibacter nataicola NRIC 0616]